MPSPTSRLAVLAVAALVVVAASCSGSDGSGSPTATTMATTTTDPAQNPATYTAFPDPGQDVVVAVGRRFGLLVRTDLSAGQRWQVSSPLDTALLLPLGTELTQANTALPGAPDTQVLTFVAQAVGTATVELTAVSASGQPVEGVAPVTFTVVVTVDGQPPPTTTTTLAPGATTSTTTPG